jgi:hypothetical protein
MSRLTRAVAVGVSLLSVGAFGQGFLEPSLHTRLEPDLKENAHWIVLRQYELETRRAGGARPEVILAALHHLEAARDPLLTRVAWEACFAGTLRWEAVLPAVQRLIDTLPAEQRDWGNHQLAAFRLEAGFAAMEAPARRDWYRKKLTEIYYPSKEDPIGPGDAAVSVMEGACRFESFYLELLPVVAHVMTNETTLGFIPRQQMEVAEACATANPAARLLTIMEEGVRADLDSGRNSSRAGGPMSTPHDDYKFNLALRAFRRLNPPEGLQRVKELLALYERAEQQRGKLDKAAATPADDRPATGSHLMPTPSPGSLTSGLARTLAELAGDLGDRDLERKVLGGRCLWDQVHEFETELLRTKQISRAQMASRQ